MFLKIYLILCFINSYDKIPDICFNIENAIIYKYDQLVELRYKNKMAPVDYRNLRMQSFNDFDFGRYYHYIGFKAEIVKNVVIRDSSYWEKTGPLEFLHNLRNDAKTTMYYYIDKRPESNWITKRHIPILMKYIHFKQPACNAVLTTSCNRPNESTMGEQAMFLIGGYIRKKYPPAPDFSYYHSSPEQFISWYEEKFKKLTTKTK